MDIIAVTIAVGDLERRAWVVGVGVLSTVSNTNISVCMQAGGKYLLCENRTVHTDT